MSWPLKVLIEMYEGLNVPHFEIWMDYLLTYFYSGAKLDQLIFM